MRTLIKKYLLYLVSIPLVSRVATYGVVLCMVAILLVSKPSPGSFLLAAAVGSVYVILYHLAYRFVYLPHVAAQQAAQQEEPQRLTLSLFINIQNNGNGKYSAWFIAFPRYVACADDPETARLMIMNLAPFIIERASADDKGALFQNVSNAHATSFDANDKVILQ